MLKFSKIYFLRVMFLEVCVLSKTFISQAQARSEITKSSTERMSSQNLAPWSISINSIIHISNSNCHVGLFFLVFVIFSRETGNMWRIQRKSRSFWLNTVFFWEFKKSNNSQQRICLFLWTNLTNRRRRKKEFSLKNAQTFLFTTVNLNGPLLNTRMMN